MLQPRTAAAAPAPRGPVRNEESAVGGIVAETTSADDLFVRSHFPRPETVGPDWSVALRGDVDRPRSWSVAELERRPSHTLRATLECAGNSRRRFGTIAPGEVAWGDRAVGCASWTGVPLLDLLDEARPRPAARYAVFTGADVGGDDRRPSQFDRSLSLGPDGPAGEVLVATRMNGAPLPPDHGGPVRLVVPGWYGMAWVKWLTTITVQRTPLDAHFQTARYIYRVTEGGRTRTAPVERIRVKSLIVAPVEGERVPLLAPTRIRGKAWSGAGAVRRVEVDTGSGWRPARLAPNDERHAWSSWDADWVPPVKGAVTLRCRATDETGASQPEVPAPNDFQYGCNSVHAVGVTVG